MEFGQLGNVGLVRIDASGNVGIYTASGTEVAYIEAASGALVFTTGSAQGPAAKPYVSSDGASLDLFLGVPTGKAIAMYANNVQTMQINPTNINKLHGITAAGLGVAGIYAAGAQSLYTNAAPTTLSYTPPATAGVYRFTGYLNALTAGTMTFRVKITYTDAGGNAVTDIPGFYLQNSTAIVAGGNTANTAGRYTMLSYPFSINNGAAAITIQDNAGTYTTGTYYWTPILEQLA